MCAPTRPSHCSCCCPCLPCAVPWQGHSAADTTPLQTPLGASLCQAPLRCQNKIWEMVPSAGPCQHFSSPLPNSYAEQWQDVQACGRGSHAGCCIPVCAQGACACASTRVFFVYARNIHVRCEYMSEGHVHRGACLRSQYRGDMRAGGVEGHVHVRGCVCVHGPCVGTCVGAMCVIRYSSFKGSFLCVHVLCMHVCWGAHICVHVWPVAG